MGWKCTLSKTEDMWKEIERKVRNAITKYKRKIISWGLGRRVWYNKEWKDKKRELRRKLRDLKKEKIEREEYVKRRREHRKWYEEQKRKHEEEEEAKIRNINIEREAWKYRTNIERRRQEGQER